MSTLNPIDTMQNIRDTYLRYLRTIYPFQDDALRVAFKHQTEQPKQLIKGPLLEAAPPFAPGRSIAQLMADGVLHPYFERLCGEALPLERPLYLHQDRAITHIAQQQRNLIVATGTGSGKTETFLLPIFNHLLQEEANGTLQHPGVRALLLYPMNALANDQLRRLRHVLERYPSFTFGRYTGETPEGEREGEERFREQFPFEPRLENELISRERMRARPPHILLTNYAMLEYLLLRPEDCDFFDGPKGHNWRFIVLDEAHVYDGASGIELGMLLRRLKERIVASKRGQLRCIATSATLGRGRDDFPIAVDFAEKLFGEPFEWVSDDPGRQDVVESTRLATAALGTLWGKGSARFYQRLQETIVSLPQNETKISEVLEPLASATSPFVPDAVVQDACDMAREQWERRSGDEADNRRQHFSIDAFLYGVLRGDRLVHTLHEHLGNEPSFIEDIAPVIFLDEQGAHQHLVNLVDLAVRARPNPDSLSLLPARYHVFARALEGVFACLHTELHEDHRPHLFLNRHETCPDCGSWVLELATCVRCGATYAVGCIPEKETSSTDNKLRQLGENVSAQSARPSYFLLDKHVSTIDEDEVTAMGDELPEQTPSATVYSICLQCGELSTRERGRCVCGGRTLLVTKMPPKKEWEQDARECICCRARSNGAIIYRFLTGQDAPVSVLATALYQQLPKSSHQDTVDLPGGGRKLLIFSDSRQDAAFFAPYMERTYNQVLHRRLILDALLTDSDGRAGELRLQDVVSRVLKEAERAGMFEQQWSKDARRLLAKTWLMQEIISLDRRLSLEGLGLLQFRLVRPERWQPPIALQSAPWNLNKEECWTLIALLLDTLRQQAVMTFLEGLDPADEQFAPRNREFFVRREQSDTRAGIFSWLPSRGSNRRINLLERFLARCSPELSIEERKQQVKSTLEGLWKHLTEPTPVWRAHFPSTSLSKSGVVYRLSHEFWELVPLIEGGSMYRCNRCRACTSLNLRGLCPTLNCQGTLELCTFGDLLKEDNHYRALYLSMPAIPLSAQEHTAQWTNIEAGKIQEQFIRGETNVLSCSTTFELGVCCLPDKTSILRQIKYLLSGFESTSYLVYLQAHCFVFRHIICRVIQQTFTGVTWGDAA